MLMELFVMHNFQNRILFKKLSHAKYIIFNDDRIFQLFYLLASHFAFVHVQTRYTYTQYIYI